MNQQQRMARVQAAATGAVGVAATGDDIEFQPVVQNQIGRDAAGDRDDDDDEPHGGRRKSRRSRKSKRSRKSRRSKRSRKSKRSRRSR